MVCNVITRWLGFEQQPAYAAPVAVDLQCLLYVIVYLCGQAPVAVTDPVAVTATYMTISWTSSRHM